MSEEYDDMRMVVCDRKSATTKADDGLNNRWTNSFNDTIQLQPGDRIAVYNSFVAEKGAGTTESIEFKSIELSPVLKTITYTQTQVLPAGDPRNNTALAESGFRTFLNQNTLTTAASATHVRDFGIDNIRGPPITYMDYCETTTESFIMKDNEANIVTNYYKTMDGNSYFQLPRRYAYDDILDIAGTPNTTPTQWSAMDEAVLTDPAVPSSTITGRCRAECVRISQQGTPFIPAQTTEYYNIDDVVGYVVDDWKVVVDWRPRVAPAVGIQGLHREGRAQKVILKNDNSRYTILKRKKNLMRNQDRNPYATADLINTALMDDYRPPYYATDPEYYDYEIYREKINVKIEPGFTSSKYVSEEITRQLNSLNTDDTAFVERQPNGAGGIHEALLTNIDQFIETETYRRFEASNDYYGQKKFFQSCIDNTILPGAGVGAGVPVGVLGPTTINGAFELDPFDMTFYQQYQYIGCKRPELYTAGTKLNDIFGLYMLNADTNDEAYWKTHGLILDLDYNDANLLLLKNFIDSQAQYPELFSKDNIKNLDLITLQHAGRPPSKNIYYDARGFGPLSQETSYVNIDNARYFHINQRPQHEYNNLLHNDPKLTTAGPIFASDYRKYSQLGNSYYDWRGNEVVNTGTGATRDDQYSRDLPNPLIPSANRYESVPFFVHYEPTLKDTLFVASEVINVNPTLNQESNSNNFTYGCFGRVADNHVRAGKIVIFPNKLLDRNGDGVGLPPSVFTDTGNIIFSGRKVGFDRHFNAWGNACICLTSGIPRYSYKPTLDGTKDYWDTETQMGIAPPIGVNDPTNTAVPQPSPPGLNGEGNYSQINYQYENDIQQYLNFQYLGADAPQLVYDGAHFSFQQLHTPLNKGNQAVLTAGDISGDEAQIVYKINPQQAYNNLTPTQYPYEETLDFEYTSTSADDSKRRRVNRNLETFQVYDTSTGIFIEDFGYTEQVWNDSLWGRLGFTYEQFHNTNAIERNKRYTDFTDTSNILTTNADVKSKDIKSWMQNKFGQTTYAGTLFHPFQFKGFKVGPASSNGAVIDFTPEIIAPTTSVSVVAKDYPTQVNNGFYNIRCDLALNTNAVMGGGDTAFPIVGIADKTNAIKDFFISSPSSISHTITRPITISSITTLIDDPDGTASRCSPNSVVIYRLTRTRETSFDILGDLQRKLAELEKQKRKK